MHDDLGERMKEYESIPKTRLLTKTPVLMRLDGKAFHTLTRDCDRPFDHKLAEAMWATAKYLCENIQGVKLAYTQSDEISLLLTDWENIKTQPWFGYEVQKMCSIAASMAAVAFTKAYGKVGFFDCRVWNLPKAEVVNAFVWRQQDATRNSIQMVGQANFSHKQLQKKSCADIQEMLFQEKGINWNNFAVWQKRGLCIVKREYKLYSLLALPDGYPDPIEPVVRTRWEEDLEIPIFTQDRTYIDKFLYNGEGDQT